VKYRLIVFDWDGTLIDSAGTIVRCIQDAAREMGLEVPAAERARHVIGLGLHDSLSHAVPGLAAARYREFADHYRRHFLARQDAMLLFAGGKSRRGLDRALDADDLRRFFSSSRCADETHPKPHPAMLLELMETLQVDKESTLMVGDTTHDLEMARAAGVDALAVTYGAHDEAGLRACSPVGCFPSVQALAAWLKIHG
jgi:phosphoglycolate phosphatase